MEKDYKYNINEVVNNQKILSRFIKYNNKGEKQKYYKIQCLKCGYITERIQCRMDKVSCGVCTNAFVVSGYNDIATTNPEFVKYFANKEDTTKYSINSHSKVDIICPYCQTINKNIEIRNLQTTFKCKVCGNKGSFNERFMKNVLNSINISFEDEKVFEWSDSKRYDIYIKDLSCIIELHGGFHYNNTEFHKLGEVKSNDLYKKQLAKEHGIKYYIELNCEKSTLEWIKNSILNSELVNIIPNIKNINWEECLYSSNMDMFEKCLELYKNGEHSARKISKQINEYRPNVVAALRYYNSIGEIEYNEETIELQRKENAANGIHKHHLKEVVCLNNGKIYETYTDAAKDSKCHRISISKCCNHINHYTIDKNGNKKFWLFKEEFDKLSEKEISEIMSFTQYYYINDYNKERMAKGE